MGAWMKNARCKESELSDDSTVGHMRILKSTIGYYLPMVDRGPPWDTNVW